MTLLEQIRFNHPVLRVNNRDRNIDFYEKSLGFKLFSEENAIAIFSAWENPDASFIIEESPSMRTRAVEGPQKANKIIIKASKARDIAALLGNGAAASQVFQGKNGYAYETVSPEGALFLLHAEDDLDSLTAIERPDLAQEPSVKGLSDFTFEKIVLNVQDVELSKAFYQNTFDGQFPLNLDFLQAQGDDLAVEPNMTWDLEILEFQVPQDYPLAELKAYLESKGLSVYLDKKERVLVISDPSKIEIWFIE